MKASNIAVTNLINCWKTKYCCVMVLRQAVWWWASALVAFCAGLCWSPGGICYGHPCCGPSGHSSCKVATGIHMLQNCDLSWNTSHTEDLSVHCAGMYLVIRAGAFIAHVMEGLLDCMPEGAEDTGGGYTDLDRQHLQSCCNDMSGYLMFPVDTICQACVNNSRSHWCISARIIHKSPFHFFKFFLRKKNWSFELVSQILHTGPAC